MPNWCQNVATFSHTDPAMMEKLDEAINNNQLFNTFFPTPFELNDSRAHSWGGHFAKEQDQLRETLRQKYGYENGNDWRNGEWGTKWDACELCRRDDCDDKSVTVQFDTAWSPPTNFYDKMVDIGFTVNALYYEGGCCFCGRYDDSGDTYYQWNDIETAMKTIPVDIDEEFNIIGTISDWEE